MAVAIAALIVGLTGTGIAAYTLPRNSVGTAQLKKAAVTNTRLANNSVGTKRIKNNAVTSLKIRNRTIKQADLSWDLWQELETKVGRRGPAGPGGPQGPQGPQGAQGPQGPQGEAAFTPEYAQYSSLQEQGGTAFAGQVVIPVLFNNVDVSPTSGISLDNNLWNWRLAGPAVYTGAYSAQVRKTGNGTATVHIWWQYATPSSGCNEDADFGPMANSSTQKSLSATGEQVNVAVQYVIPVPASGMCARLVAQSTATIPSEAEEMIFPFEPASGYRPAGPSFIANVWRIA